MTSPAALAGVRAGLHARDAVVLDGLVRQHHARVFHYLVGITRNRHDAEDLSQETWLRVIERGAQYEGDGAFEGWLLAIARNLALDRARKSARDGGGSAELGRRPCVWTGPSPLDAASHAEMSGWLRKAVEALPPHVQSVWQLRFGLGLPLETIAARLQIAPGTVRSRLHRGTRALRTAFPRRPCVSDPAVGW